MEIVAAYLLCALLSGFPSAQATSVHQWRESDPCCSRLSRDTGVEKRLSADGVVVTASLAKRDGYITATIRIENPGNRPLQVATGDVTLLTGPTSTDALPARSAREVADGVQKRAAGIAAGLDAQGLAATTVAHEQVPTMVTVPNPAALSDPGQPATITTAQTETVVKVVPNEPERMRLQNEASAARKRAAREAEKIVAGELVAGAVPAGGQVAGNRYFASPDGMRAVRLRIQINLTTVEIPFAASRSARDGWK